MALRALASHYWPGDGVENNPPDVGGYFRWQITVLYSTFGFIPFHLPRWLERRVETWVAQFWRHIPERLYILIRLLSLCWGEEWRRAREAVRDCACTPGMADRKAWGEIGQRAGQHRGVGENLFRNMRAVQVYGEHPHHFYEVNVRLELAWMALKERHR